MSAIPLSAPRYAFAGLARIVEGFGRAQGDTDEVRLQKALLLAFALMIIPAAILWGSIYLFFGEALAASLPFSYAAASVLSFAVFGLTKRYSLFRSSQLLLILLVPFALMYQLGGFVGGSAVVLWSLLCPLGALLLSGRRQAVAWFLAFIALIAASGLLEVVDRPANALPPALVTTFFAMNIAGPTLTAILLLNYFVGRKNTAMRLLRQEQEKSDRLLLNVLPGEIAAILRDGPRTIADHFDAVSVLFADVVGFTTLSVELSPTNMVDLLNELFSNFDSLVDKYGLEKIRTIGDNYMVASGVPRPRRDHALALAAMALEMNRFISHRPLNGGPAVRFRIGINSGPALAGVIGHTKFHYDLWGDAVNIASRMESHGVPGKIQITQATYEIIKDDFICTPRGKVDIKGKGEMETWFLEASRS